MTPADLNTYLVWHSIRSDALALCLGVAPRTVRSWLNGDRAIPAPVVKLLKLVDDGILTFEQIATA